MGTTVTPLRPSSRDNAATRDTTRQRRNRKRRAEKVPASAEAEPIALPVPDAWPTSPIRDAAQSAAAVTAPESTHVARLIEPVEVTESVVQVPATVSGMTGAPVAAEPVATAGYSIAHHDRGRLVDVLAYLAAITLACAAAWFSIRGMVVLYPGSPVSVVMLAIAMEAGKLTTAAYLAARWRETAWLWRVVLIVLVAGLAVINGVGVFSQLVQAHVGIRAANTSSVEAESAAIAARIDAQQHIVADLDRRLSQIDGAIEEATRRGRTKAAMATMESQQRARAAIAEERRREAATLVALQGEHAQATAAGHQVEADAAPIRYVAELLGVDTDSEKAIRWLTLLMVLCADPLAVALTAATASRRTR
jgi:hypothetical protein